MKIVYPSYGIEIALSEDCVSVLTVENAIAFRRMTGDLWAQMEGAEGEWILSDQEKILSLSKAVEGIFNLFSMDCNEKKVLTKIYSELSTVAVQEYPIETAELNGHIVEYLDQLFQKTPYHLGMRAEMDVSALLKAFETKIESCAENLLEKLIDYVRAMHWICHINIFIFVNLKQCMTAEELLQFYEYANYEKIMLLLLEGNYREANSLEKNWILDKDLCMIEVAG